MTRISAVVLLSVLSFGPLLADIPPTEPDTANDTQIDPQIEKQPETPAESQITELQAIMFNPPQGWNYADVKQLPASVKVMVVGKGKTAYPPSINIGMEKYAGSLKSYLKIVKGINDKQKADWKDLGTIETQAGPASLSQVDMRTKWGEVRLMHVILVRDGYAYIMTAAALRDEFPEYYKDMFTAMRSLRFGPPPAEETSAEALLKK